MTEANDALTIANALLDAFNRGDQAGVRALLAENVTEHEPLEQEAAMGPDAVIANMWGYRNSFPDLHSEVTDGFACGDRAAIRFTAVGSYEPATYGPDAKRVTWQGCLIFRMDGGRIVEVDLYLDWLDAVRQLGDVALGPFFRPT
jgi:steroid delta-isomerase-like uncharacterized protein